MFLLTDQTIIAADRAARQRFVYQADPKGMDRWQSKADQVAMGVRWYGDCDDLASTTLDILIQQGRTKEARDTIGRNAFRLKVKSDVCPPNAPYDHMIAAARDHNGQVWIIGDTFLSAHKFERSPHKLHLTGRLNSYSLLDDGVLWRVGPGEVLNPYKA